MGGTTTVNDSLRPPKHRQFSLEAVEDHYLEWLEKCAGAKVVGGVGQDRLKNFCTH